MKYPSQKKYFEYLKTISWRGKAYFRYYLYPRLNHHLAGKTLDVGCGLGYLFDIRDNSIGVDINPYCVDYCKNNGHEAYYFPSAKYLFNDNYFNSVLLNNVLEHIESPTTTIKEIYRVLKPNGLFIVGVPGIKGYKKDPDHKVFYNEKLLTDILVKEGFRRCYYFHTPFKSDYLNHNLNAYSLFGVFKKCV